MADRRTVHRAIRAAGVPFAVTESVPFQRGSREIVSAGVRTVAACGHVYIYWVGSAGVDSVSVGVMRTVLDVVPGARVDRCEIVTLADYRDGVRDVADIPADTLAMWGVERCDLRRGLAGFVASVPLSVVVD